MSIVSTTTYDEQTPVFTTVECLCGAIGQACIEIGRTQWVECWRCKRRSYLKVVYADVTTTHGSNYKESV